MDGCSGNWPGDFRDNSLRVVFVRFANPVSHDSGTCRFPDHTFERVCELIKQFQMLIEHGIASLNRRKRGHCLGR